MKRGAVMLVINSVEYDSYIDMCKAYNIDCKEFFEYKKNNSDISTLDLLGHFIPNIGVCMDNGHYITKNRQQVQFKQKPNCKLIGENGNIYNLMSIAMKILRENGQSEQADEMFERITKTAESYHQALAIIMEYVEVY